MKDHSCTSDISSVNCEITENYNKFSITKEQEQIYMKIVRESVGNQEEFFYVDLPYLIINNCFRDIGLKYNYTNVENSSLINCDIKVKDYIIACIYSAINLSEELSSDEIFNALSNNSRVHPSFYIDQELDIFGLNYDLKRIEMITYSDLLASIHNQVNNLKQTILDSDIRQNFVDYIRDYSEKLHIPTVTKELIKFHFNQHDINLNERFEFEFKDKSRNGLESKLHSSLLNNPKEKVGRYMSFDSFFKTINEGKLYFGSVIAMNDKSEVDYYMKNVYEKFDYFKNLRGPDIDNINRNFITSYVDKDKIDDLTLWRLYGEDGRGVCLIFRLKQNNNYDNYIIKKISYEPSKTEKSERTGKTEITQHDEVVFLKNFFDFFKQINHPDYVYATTFNFNQSHNWRYFFKSKEYSSEEEVRLLIVNEHDCIKPQWRVINNIIVPSVLIDFKTKNFPLVLTEVIIGPKAYEKDINLKQIEHFLEVKGFEDVIVKKSTINNYR